MRDVAAILLASGFSRRFGIQDKLLYPYRGKPLARYALELAARSGLFRPVVYVAARMNVAALALSPDVCGPGADIRIAYNKHPEKGLRESVRLGVMAAGDARYYMFFPCDMPWLDCVTVNAVLARAAPGKIIRPVHAGQPGNPCVFAADFRDDLLSLKAGEQPRLLAERWPERVVSVEIANGAVLGDMDRRP
jgi:molybdenum cofactor cytidylyltransferase